MLDTKSAKQILRKRFAQDIVVYLKSPRGGSEEANILQTNTAHHQDLGTTA